MVYEIERITNSFKTASRLSLDSMIDLWYSYYTNENKAFLLLLNILNY